VGLRDHDQIVACRQIVLQQPECLTDAPADAVARHGIAHAAGNGHAQATVAQAIGPAGDAQRPGVAGDAAGADTLELVR
jgi:hypothetical protein